MHINYLVGYQGSNIYYIQVLQNNQIVTVYNVEFNKDKIFNSNKKPIYKYCLQVYRKDSNNAKPLLDIYQFQDSNTDSEIKSIIIVSNKNSYRDNRISYGGNKINKINLETNSEYKDKSRNYPILQSLDKQANIGQNSNILLKSLLL